VNLINIFKFYKYIRNLVQTLDRPKSHVLIEVFEQTPSLISFLFFFISLNSRKNLKPILYKPTNDNYYKDRIKEFLPLSISNLFKVFFKCKTILYPKTEKKNSKKINKILKKIKSKKDLINLKIDNIWVGDLFYDNFLRKNDLITIDTSTEAFKKEIKNYVQLFFYWDNYFKTNKINAIIFSHSVYLIGLPARIAIHRKIRSYLVRSSDVVMISKKYLHAYDGYNEYPNLFKQLNTKRKAKALRLSEKEIRKRLSGQSDKLTKKNQPNEISPFSKKIIDRNNKNKRNKKIRILVATHDFNDAVHVYGKNLFCDFHDWLIYLGEFSLKKNFEWLIKFHPADYDGNLSKAKEIMSKYKNFTLLEKNTTHNELIENGIDCVLTVYGSIGHEYPLMNIPVINAGNNPHVGYNFNYNPKTIGQYLKYLNKIKKIKVNKNAKKKILEFYYINFLIDYSPLDDLTSFYALKDQKKIFDYLINKQIHKKEKKIISSYDNFIKSKKRKLII
jgi:hypothetical protein